MPILFGQMILWINDHSDKWTVTIPHSPDMYFSLISCSLFCQWERVLLVACRVLCSLLLYWRHSTQLGKCLWKTSLSLSILTAIFQIWRIFLRHSLLTSLVIWETMQGISSQNTNQTYWYWACHHVNTRWYHYYQLQSSLQSNISLFEHFPVCKYNTDICTASQINLISFCFTGVFFWKSLQISPGRVQHWSPGEDVIWRYWLLICSNVD